MSTSEILKLPGAGQAVSTEGRPLPAPGADMALVCPLGARKVSEPSPRPGVRRQRYSISCLCEPPLQLAWTLLLLTSGPWYVCNSWLLWLPCLPLWPHFGVLYPYSYPLMFAFLRPSAPSVKINLTSNWLSLEGQGNLRAQETRIM